MMSLVRVQFGEPIFYRGIAPMVEQRSPKPRVVSSSLTAPVMKHLRFFVGAFFMKIDKILTTGLVLVADISCTGLKRGVDTK